MDVSRPYSEGEVWLERGGFLTVSDRDDLSGFPAEIDADDLARCFTLHPSDHTEIVGRRHG
ncbi:MAG: DUF4158 domain-containing protein, partial [Acidimicrobiia bacterium]|nr:DUF4158 domain-containing protein [Acidimicrobiia bacterium]